MTPRTSVRAAARAHFVDLVHKQASAPDAPPPDANTPDEPPAAPAPDDLVAQARALYEDSAVPVRAIAAEIGVSERTIYKYAFRLGWRPRYCWADDSAAMRGRGWRAAGPYAPAGGAGGRFVRREEAGKPHAEGLKALDPAGRSEAVAACAKTARIVALAEAEAAQDRETDALVRGVKAMLGCLRDYVRMARARAGHALTPLDGQLVHAHTALFDAAAAHCDRLTTRWYAGHLALQWLRRKRR